MILKRFRTSSAGRVVKWLCLALLVSMSLGTVQHFEIAKDPEIHPLHVNVDDCLEEDGHGGNKNDGARQNNDLKDLGILEDKNTYNKFLNTYNKQMKDEQIQMTREDIIAGVSSKAAFPGEPIYYWFMPHTHNDLGWVLSEELYWQMTTRDTLLTQLLILPENPAFKLTFAESKLIYNIATEFPDLRDTLQ